VADELNHESTPEVLLDWLASRPSWLEVRQPAHLLDTEADLDWGEQEAIALAEEVSANLLLVDDWDARQEAERRQLRVVGTLRVLADGAGRGLSDLQEDLELLRCTNFRVNPELLESLLDEYRRGFEVK